MLYALAVFLTAGTLTMNVQGTAAPGPRFFPILVCILLYGVATALTVSVLRSPSVPDTRKHPDHGNFSDDMLRDLAGLPAQKSPAGPAGTWRTYSDWRTVGLVLLGVVVFTAVLNLLGWILSAAFLFWIICYALGSRRPVFDAGVSLLFASAIQLAFNAGLGLNLPSGFLGGLL
ncbi:tripartite tricarboxylate transporter TctB family protein [Arthrobacter koreensis]|uniref:tripartite tricarboxylate transporter TctB family protein n=1 Tax=Arthrobacter koreensis TaxID=199136 RepID=UPI002DBB53C7|nr:tripartite tricarboxylate transporter TctB family protein [Arthrobacter koreensis]